MARELADRREARVLVIDRRHHIAGNAYDYYDEAGVQVHKYGPHIFHTNSAKIVGYLSRFTEWRPYEHRVLARVDGQLLPIPINRTTINRLYGLELTSEHHVESFVLASIIGGRRRTSVEQSSNVVYRPFLEHNLAGKYNSDTGNGTAEAKRSASSGAR